MLASFIVPSLLLTWASSVAATPTHHKYHSCPVDYLEIEGLPHTIPKPTMPLAFVSVAIGTQNYTCTEHGNYTATGAVAELYDISCLGHSPLFAWIQDKVFAHWKEADKHTTTSQVMDKYSRILPSQGQHYFIPNPVTGQGVSPKWDFTSTGPTSGDKHAFVTAARLDGDKAPTGPQDIDWVALTSIDGGLAKEVYRTDTREGQPPSGWCQPGSGEITVKYASKYWYYGTSIHSHKKHH